MSSEEDVESILVEVNGSSLINRNEKEEDEGITHWTPRDVINEQDRNQGMPIPGSSSHSSSTSSEDLTLHRGSHLNLNSQSDMFLMNEDFMAPPINLVFETCGSLLDIGQIPLHPQPSYSNLTEHEDNNILMVVYNEEDEIEWDLHPNDNSIQLINQSIDIINNQSGSQLEIINQSQSQIEIINLSDEYDLQNQLEIISQLTNNDNQSENVEIISQSIADIQSEEKIGSANYPIDNSNESEKNESFENNPDVELKDLNNHFESESELVKVLEIEGVESNKLELVKDSKKLETGNQLEEFEIVEQSEEISFSKQLEEFKSVERLGSEIEGLESETGIVSNDIQDLDIKVSHKEKESEEVKTLEDAMNPKLLLLTALSCNEAVEILSPLGIVEDADSSLSDLTQNGPEKIGPVLPIDDCLKQSLDIISDGDINSKDFAMNDVNNSSIEKIENVVDIFHPLDEPGDLSSVPFADSELEIVKVTTTNVSEFSVDAMKGHENENEATNQAIHMEDILTIIPNNAKAPANFLEEGEIVTCRHSTTQMDLEEAGDIITLNDKAEHDSEEKANDVDLKSGTLLEEHLLLIPSVSDWENELKEYASFAFEVSKTEHNLPRQEIMTKLDHDKEIIPLAFVLSSIDEAEIEAEEAVVELISDQPAYNILEGTEISISQNKKGESELGGLEAATIASVIVDAELLEGKGLDSALQAISEVKQEDIDVATDQNYPGDCELEKAIIAITAEDVLENDWEEARVAISCNDFLENDVVEVGSAKPNGLVESDIDAEFTSGPSYIQESNLEDEGDIRPSYLDESEPEQTGGPIMPDIHNIVVKGVRIPITPSDLLETDLEEPGYDIYPNYISEGDPEHKDVGCLNSSIEFPKHELEDAGTPIIPIGFPDSELEGAGFASVTNTFHESNFEGFGPVSTLNDLEEAGIAICLDDNPEVGLHDANVIITSNGIYEIEEEVGGVAKTFNDLCDVKMSTVTKTVYDLPECDQEEAAIVIPLSDIPENVLEDGKVTVPSTCIHEPDEEVGNGDEPLNDLSETYVETATPTKTVYDLPEGDLEEAGSEIKPGLSESVFEEEIEGISLNDLSMSEQDATRDAVTYNVLDVVEGENIRTTIGSTDVLEEVLEDVLVADSTHDLFEESYEELRDIPIDIPGNELQEGITSSDIFEFDKDDINRAISPSHLPQSVLEDIQVPISLNDMKFIPLSPTQVAKVQDHLQLDNNNESFIILSNDLATIQLEEPNVAIMGIELQDFPTIISLKGITENSIEDDEVNILLDSQNEHVLVEPIKAPDSIEALEQWLLIPGVVNPENESMLNPVEELPNVFDFVRYPSPTEGDHVQTNKKSPTDIWESVPGVIVVDDYSQDEEILQQSKNPSIQGEETYLDFQLPLIIPLTDECMVGVNDTEDTNPKDSIVITNQLTQKKTGPLTEIRKLLQRIILLPFRRFFKKAN